MFIGSLAWEIGKAHDLWMVAMLPGALNCLPG
jgi:hypothetical protein